MYIEELIGPDTVNTVPEATYAAMKDHGKVAVTLTKDLAEADAVMRDLASVDISLRQATDDVLTEGVVLFEDAFDKLLAAVEQRRREILGTRLDRMEMASDKAVDAELEQLRKNAFSLRLWAKDATLWGSSKKDDPAVSGFMGWLGAVDAMSGHTQAL